MLVLIDINLHFNFRRFREKLLRRLKYIIHDTLVNACPPISFLLTKGTVYRDSKCKRSQHSHKLYESPLQEQLVQQGPENAWRKDQ
jgi:hypothetical protein